MMKYKETYKNILVFIISIIFFLIIFEIGLRILYSSEFQPTKIYDFYEYDKELGWKNKPDSEGIFHIKDRKSYIKISSKGIRDKDYDYENQENKKRVIVLGDSFMFGYGINSSERFSEILETRYFKDIDMINMGVSGYGTDQEFLLMKKEGIRYDPDIVMIAYYSISDRRDNSQNFRNEHSKPMFIITENNTLRLTNQPVPKYDKDTKQKINKDNFIFYLDKTASRYSYSYMFFRSKMLTLPFLKNNIIQFLGGEDIGSQLKTTSLIFQEIKDYLNSKDIKLVVVMIPTKEQVYFDTYVEDTEYLSEYFKENNILSIDLLPYFKERSKENKNLYFQNEGVHWTKKGNELAAEIIYKEIIEKGLISQKDSIRIKEEPKSPLDQIMWSPSSMLES